MAKKSRKARAAARSGKALPRSENKQQQMQVASQKSEQHPTQVTSKKPAKQMEAVAVNILQPEKFDYVKSDLIRIGIISASLIIILIVLTFVPALRT